VIDPRDRLALALDVDDLVDATRLAERLRPYFGVAKVGLELYSAAGPEAVAALRDLGYRVFGDLKLHDIPTTVERAARVLGAIGVDLLTIHAAGGAEMLAAGVAGLREGARQAGLPEPMPLAVTILTSDAGAGPEVFAARIQTALEAGCPGIVCSASDVAEAKRLGPELFAAVPGIRPAGADHHDQVRVATPEGALAAGADLLVIGRPVTRAQEPEVIAQALRAAVAP
jgi:orotidine-5'-phosphate decarboxylase